VPIYPMPVILKVVAPPVIIYDVTLFSVDGTLETELTHTETVESVDEDLVVGLEHTETVKSTDEDLVIDLNYETVVV